MNEEKLLLDEVAELNSGNIEKLKKGLHKDEWTLCLGAGVSRSAGLPDWYTLLSKMMARLMCLDVGSDFGCSKDEDGWEYRQAKVNLVRQCGKSADYKSKLADALEGRKNMLLKGKIHWN